MSEEEILWESSIKPTKLGTVIELKIAIPKDIKEEKLASEFLDLLKNILANYILVYGANRENNSMRKGVPDSPDKVNGGEQDGR